MVRTRAGLNTQLRSDVSLCHIPSVMFEVRYAGVDRAAGSLGKLVQGSCWTLNLLGPELFF